MKNQRILISLLAPLLLFVPLAKSQDAPASCNAASVHGPYELTFSGFGNPGRGGTATGNASQVPAGAVGIINFDGAGNVTLSYTFAEGGRISTSTLATPDIGNYTVNPVDCTAIIYDTAISTQYNMVPVGGWTEMFGVLANYTPAGVHLKKQNVPAGGCNSGSLTGKYGFKLVVSDSPGNAHNYNPGATHEVAVGTLAFDGGHLSASYTLNNADVVSVVAGDTGTYLVNSDCTGSLTDGTAGLDFNFVIVNGGSELYAVQSDTGYVSLLQAKMQ